MDVYTTRIRTVGNPSRQQYAPITEPEDFWAYSIDSLRDKLIKFQSFNMVGMSNWIVPVIYKNGESIGSFSYNLRLWDDHKEITNEELQEMQ